MSGTLVSFLAMAIGGRELSDELSTFQILFFRSLIGLLAIGLVAMRSRRSLLRTQRLGRHVLRNVAHFGGQFGWFFGIAWIPLAEVFAIEFTVPIWAALLAAAVLGERLNGRHLLVLATGIGGVLVVLRPGSGLIHPAALAVLLGAIAYAVAHVQTKQLVQTDSPIAVLFYMALIQLPLGLIGALSQWRVVQGTQLPWLFVVGVSALTAHYCLTHALKLANVSTVLPLDFLRLPLVAVLGFVFYGETIDAWLVVGTVLIIGANALNLFAQARPR